MFARITLGAVVSAAIRSTRTPHVSVVARRTLFATPHFNFPSARPSQVDTHETAGKQKNEGRGRPPKNPAGPEAEQPKLQKQRVRVPGNLKPPKRAPGPFALFYASFVKTQPKASTRKEVQELSKGAAEIWRGYSIAEKQPFYDEAEIRKVQAKQEREEFFRNTSRSDLRQLNAIRKAQGKTKYHAIRKPSAVLSPYILFSNEFRNSSDGQALINETSPEKKYAVRAVVAAADRWRSMSVEERAPYVERSKKAKEELKQNSPIHDSST